MATWQPETIDGISPQRVVLRGAVPTDGVTYYAAAAGDSPFTAGTILLAGTALPVPQPAWFYPEVHPEREPAVFANLDIPIVATTADILVIDKPHGLPGTPQGRIVWYAAQSQLRRQLDEPDLVAVHRLDRQTGGLLLFSRTPDNRGFLQTQFQRREVHKTYEAWAEDSPEFSLGERTFVELRMQKIPHDPQVKVVHAGRSAKSAGKLTQTWVTKTDQRSAEGLVRYQLEPITGRTHQLRALMNHYGVPIVGDDTYPVYRPRDFSKLKPQLQLRAIELGLCLPNGEYRQFSLPASQH